MSFFDSKQEVINIELTQYGKDRFSKGLFDPTYYSFHDNDIIYDMSWAGISEEQNEIETRILENSVYMKPIYNFSDREKDNKENYELVKDRASDDFNLKSAKNISTNNSINNYIPAWDIKIYKGICENYVISNKDILEINLKKLSINVSGETLNDFKIKAEEILIEFNEINCISQKDNFEIILYEVDDSSQDTNNKNNLKQISFGKEPIYIKDGVLLEKPIFPTSEPENDNTKVEYYFNITTDKKINNLTLQEIKLKEIEIYNSTFNEENK